MELKELIKLRHDLLLLAREFEPECVECQFDLANAYFEWCTMGTVKVENIKEINSDPESN